MYITINYTLKYANIENLKAVTITATKIKNIYFTSLWVLGDNNDF